MIKGPVKIQSLRFCRQAPALFVIREIRNKRGTDTGRHVCNNLNMTMCNMEFLISFISLVIITSQNKFLFRLNPNKNNNKMTLLYFRLKQI